MKKNTLARSKGVDNYSLERSTDGGYQYGETEDNEVVAEDSSQHGVLTGLLEGGYVLGHLPGGTLPCTSRYRNPRRDSSAGRRSTGI
jgi:hypothetical protein